MLRISQRTAALRFKDLLEDARVFNHLVEYNNQTAQKTLAKSNSIRSLTHGHTSVFQPRKHKLAELIIDSYPAEVIAGVNHILSANSQATVLHDD